MTSLCSPDAEIAFTAGSAIAIRASRVSRRFRDDLAETGLVLKPVVPCRSNNTFENSNRGCDRLSNRTENTVR